MSLENVKDFFKVSTESENLEAAEIDTDEDIDDVVDEKIEEIKDLEEEYAEEENASFELFSAASSLEKICDLIEESLVSHGGLTKVSAESVAFSTNLILESIGVEEYPIEFSGFFEEDKRADLTRVSLENTKNIVVRTWEAIRDAIKKAIDFLIKLFKEVFHAVTRMGKKLEKLRSELESLKKKGDVTPKGKVRVPPELSFFGKYNVEDIIDGLRETDKVSFLVYRKYVPAVSMYYEQVSNIRIDFSKFKTIVEFEEEATGKAKATLKLFDVVDQIRGKEISGGFVFDAEQSEIDDSRRFLTSKKRDHSSGQAVNIDTPDISMLFGILEGLNDVMARMVESERPMKGVNRWRDHAISALDVALYKARGSTAFKLIAHEVANRATLGAKSMAEYAVNRVLVSLVHKDFVRAPNMLYSHTAKVILGGLRLIEASMKNYV